jgi:hypothetical protein
MNDPATGQGDIHNAPCRKGYITKNKRGQEFHDLFYFLTTI